MSRCSQVKLMLFSVRSRSLDARSRRQFWLLIRLIWEDTSRERNSKRNSNGGRREVSQMLLLLYCYWMSNNLWGGVLGLKYRNSEWYHPGLLCDGCYCIREGEGSSCLFRTVWKGRFFWHVLWNGPWVYVGVEGMDGWPLFSRWAFPLGGLNCTWEMCDCMLSFGPFESPSYSSSFFFYLSSFLPSSEERLDELPSSSSSFFIHFSLSSLFISLSVLSSLPTLSRLLLFERNEWMDSFRLSVRQANAHFMAWRT